MKSLKKYLSPLENVETQNVSNHITIDAESYDDPSFWVMAFVGQICHFSAHDDKFELQNAVAHKKLLSNDWKSA